MNLQDALNKICADHGLTCLSVGVNFKQAPDARYDAYVHWDGYSNSGHNCTSALGNSPEQAIRKALGRMTQDRFVLGATIDITLELEQA